MFAGVIALCSSSVKEANTPSVSEHVRFMFLSLLIHVRACSKEQRWEAGMAHMLLNLCACLESDDSLKTAFACLPQNVRVSSHSLRVSRVMQSLLSDLVSLSFRVHFRTLACMLFVCLFCVVLFVCLIFCSILRFVIRP